MNACRRLSAAGLFAVSAWIFFITVACRPRFAATQFRAATGRRTPAGRGLAPLDPWSLTIAASLACGPQVAKATLGHPRKGVARKKGDRRRLFLGISWALSGWKEQFQTPWPAAPRLRSNTGPPGKKGVARKKGDRRRLFLGVSWALSGGKSSSRLLGLRPPGCKATLGHPEKGARGTTRGKGHPRSRRSSNGPFRVSAQKSSGSDQSSKRLETRRVLILDCGCFFVC